MKTKKPVVVGKGPHPLIYFLVDVLIFGLIGLITAIIITPISILTAIILGQNFSVLQVFLTWFLFSFALSIMINWALRIILKYLGE